jgi:hypothetical protein
LGITFCQSGSSFRDNISRRLTVMPVSGDDSAS